jgi:predicted TIM-barrel fold metal-dependent hydrolase
MYNVHAHAWEPEKHIAAATRAEADRSRGRPMDLSVDFEHFMEEEAAPFDKTYVFGAKAKRTGYWVPDEYIAEFVGRAPDKLVGFAACDPTQEGALAELRKGIEELGLRGVKMMPMYAGFDPRDERCQPIYAYCQEQKLPILFHSGTTFNQDAPLGYTRPWLWDEVGMRYPELSRDALSGIADDPGACGPSFWRRVLGRHSQAPACLCRHLRALLSPLAVL